jgi:hypothetical protein
MTIIETNSIHNRTLGAVDLTLAKGDCSRPLGSFFRMLCDMESAGGI